MPLFCVNVARDSFWLRIGRLGVSVTSQDASCMDAWTVARTVAMGATVRLCWL